MEEVIDLIEGTFRETIKMKDLGFVFLVEVDGFSMEVGVAGIKVIVEGNFNWANETSTLWFDINFLPLIFLPLKSKSLVVIVEPAIDFMGDLLAVGPELPVYFDEIDLHFEVWFV